MSAMSPVLNRTSERHSAVAPRKKTLSPELDSVTSVSFVHNLRSLRVLHGISSHASWVI